MLLKLRNMLGAVKVEEGDMVSKILKADEDSTKILEKYAEISTRNVMLSHIRAIYYKIYGKMIFTAKLGKEDLEEFKKLLYKDDEESVVKFLKSKTWDYQKILKESISEYKKDIIPIMEKELASKIIK